MDANSPQPVLARLGSVVFSCRAYDPLTDLLELWNGEREGSLHHTTPEGHELLLGQEGSVVGLVVKDYQARLFDGPIEVTLPGEHELDPAKADRRHLWMPSLYGGMCA